MFFKKFVSASTHPTSNFFIDRIDCIRKGKTLLVISKIAFIEEVARHAYIY